MVHFFTCHCFLLSFDSNVNNKTICYLCKCMEIYYTIPVYGLWINCKYVSLTLYCYYHIPIQSQTRKDKHFAAPFLSISSIERGRQFCLASGHTRNADQRPTFLKGQFGSSCIFCGERRKNGAEICRVGEIVLFLPVKWRGISSVG